MGETKGQTGRDDSFWNQSVVLLKSTVQPQWLEMVHNAKRKPNLWNEWLKWRYRGKNAQ